MPVLYLKHRPQKFSEIVGQDHVVTTLQNALGEDRVGHAYLFAGPRGIGKTSVARILARAINCQESDSVEPCGECDVCRAVSRGNFLDLVEIDAASNRGIDDVRALRERVNFQPVQGKFKVYVLDEVHMLTKEAFNALLKTLEEPPEHAVFILCTTEPHRLPSTVISRCQRFDFHLASQRTLFEFLKQISKGEDLSISDQALQLIAQRARGSYRDALGLLEQITSYSDGKVDDREVVKVLGLTMESEAQELFNLLAGGNSKGVILKVGELSREGKDMVYLAESLLRLVRDKLRAQMVEEKGGAFTLEQLTILAEYLQSAIGESKGATLPALPLEVAILKFRRRLEGGGLNTKNTQLAGGSGRVNDCSVGRESVGDGGDADLKNKLTEANSILDLEGMWEEVMEKVKPFNHSVHALLKASQPRKYESGTVYLAFTYKFHKERIEDVKNRQLVEKVLSQVLGEQVRIRCTLKEVRTTGKSKSNDQEVCLESEDEEISSESLGEEELVKMAQKILGGEVEDV